MLDTAVVSDLLCLLLPPLMAAQGEDRANGSFPRIGSLALYVPYGFHKCHPRLEQEGQKREIARLSDQIGAASLNRMVRRTGQACQDRCAVLERTGCARAATDRRMAQFFRQMIFIHYEALINDMIDLGDLDLDAAIARWLPYFSR